MVDAVDETNRQDVWDDSALVQSWNEALAEYKVSPTTIRKPQDAHDFDHSVPEVSQHPRHRTSS